jgi:hypothetical protein
VGSKRPAGAVCGDVVICPNGESIRCNRDDFDALAGIRRHVAGLKRPCEQAAHRLNEIDGLCGGPGSRIPASDYVASFPIAQFRGAEFLFGVFENVDALALGCGA